MVVVYIYICIIYVHISKIPYKNYDNYISFISHISFIYLETNTYLGHFNKSKYYLAYFHAEFFPYPEKTKHSLLVSHAMNMK